MAVQFSIPKSPKRTINTIDVFLGADFTNSPANVDMRRSPNVKNMIRDVPGKVRKCMGWHIVKTYEKEKINGCHFLKLDSSYIIHAGTNLYHGDEVIYSDMNDHRSRSWQFGEKLYIIDGKNYLCYWQTKEEDEIVHHVEPIEKVAFIPTVTISKDPDGGGTSYQDLNMVQPGFTELFLGKEDVTEYQLSFSGLDETPVEIEVLNDDGEWTKKEENTDFTVDRETGTITFTTAPGVSPVTGEDNIKITAYRTVSGYADKIKKCTVGILYGIKGGKDRLFLSGNSEYRNYDWYSESYDPTYFADTSYSRLGADNSSIIGYSIVNSRLATHKDDIERDQNVIIRQGTVDDEKREIFVVTTSLQGIGAIAPDSFGYLETEPLFLTSQGVFAITAQDVTGERYAQNRSYYLNGKLLKEDNLKNAYACVYNDNYWLCINNVAYILDGLQPMRTDSSEPYATRQYAGFYRTNVPANIMWEYDGMLWFGDYDGNVCRFYTDKTLIMSYNDNGKPIECVWETPDIDGALFYKNKTLRYIATRTEAAAKSSISMYAMERGEWRLIKEDDEFSRYFSFRQVKFSELTFAQDTTHKISRAKCVIKRVDKFRLRFTNKKVDEPFSLFDIAMEYVENGYFKG